MLGPVTVSTDTHLVEEDHPIVEQAKRFLDADVCLVFSKKTGCYWLGVWKNRWTGEIRELLAGGPSLSSFGPDCWDRLLKSCNPSNWDAIIQDGKEASLGEHREIAAREARRRHSQSQFDSFNRNSMDRRGRDYRGTPLEVRLF